MWITHATHFSQHFLDREEDGATVRGALSLFRELTSSKETNSFVFEEHKVSRAAVQALFIPARAFILSRVWQLNTTLNPCQCNSQIVVCVNTFFETGLVHVGPACKLGLIICMQCYWLDVAVTTFCRIFKWLIKSYIYWAHWMWRSSNTVLPFCSTLPTKDQISMHVRNTPN